MGLEVQLHRGDRLLHLALQGHGNSHDDGHRHKHGNRKCSLVILKNKQMSLSGLMDELSQARTKKKEFLEQMDQLIPWEKWVEEIRPCYYKGKRGNKPYGIDTNS